MHYQGDTGTPNADLLTVKLLINSTIPAMGAKFMTMDKKDCYLHTPVAQCKYMRLKLSNILADIIKHYKLNDIATPD